MKLHKMELMRINQRIPVSLRLMMTLLKMRRKIRWLKPIIQLKITQKRNSSALLQNPELRPWLVTQKTGPRI